MLTSLRPPIDRLPPDPQEICPGLDLPLSYSCFRAGPSATTWMATDKIVRLYTLHNPRGTYINWNVLYHQIVLRYVNPH